MTNQRNVTTKAAAEDWTLVPQPWWPAMPEYNREVFDFMSQRLGKYSGMMRDMAECRNWGELSELQAKWLQEAFKDWSAEATKLMRIAVQQPTDGLQATRVQ